ncbi:MAG TPA: alpha/beta hydrolase [Saprospiraceae bacterium]|nr:alpha/beta hydrolase [Saprospiraceae bacterium]HMQ82694.1 alpha/beta hydrolase [Saprospiraceae bacterium]
MKKTVTIWLILAWYLTASAQDEMPLYSGKIPNSRDVAHPEKVDNWGPRDRFIRDTSIPTITAYLPKNPNGKAIVICPGGGYSGVAIDKEGLLVAEILAQDSIAAFVLKYRRPMDITNVDKSLAPLQDAQQAIRYVRKNASKYGIDPQKIGIMGFSAGGHLASSAATHFYKIADSNELDTTSVRPDFVVLIYPVISFTDELTHMGSRSNLLGEQANEAEVLKWSNEEQVRPDAPPAFLIHTADDEVVSVGNSIAYYQACLENGVPVEMHLYPYGGHGFGMFNKTTQDDWMGRLKNWLKGLK